MKTVKFEGTTESAWGKPLAQAVPFKYEIQAYENTEEIRAANDWPSNDEILKFVNNKRKLVALGKARDNALEAIGEKKPTLETSDLMQLQTLYKVFVASGLSEDEARAKASQSINKPWPDED